MATVQLGSSFQHKFGESPIATIRVGVSHAGGASIQSLLMAGGFVHGSMHPEYSFLFCFDGSVNEVNAYYAECTYQFRAAEIGAVGFEPNPLARPDQWNFSTGGVAVPTFVWLDGSSVKPLVNSAGDIIEGAMTDEAELTCSISGNRATFPIGLAISYTNAINSDGFMGGSPGTWKCVGISGQPQVEIVNQSEIRYYSITAEIVYRASGWKLRLPDIGFNYLDGTEKKRATVKNDDGDEIASSSPIALNSDGSKKTTGVPDILERPVNIQLPFGTAFGAFTG